MESVGAGVPLSGEHSESVGAGVPLRGEHSESVGVGVPLSGRMWAYRSGFCEEQRT